MVLLWCAETATAPTYRNLDSSFEQWAFRNGFKRRLDLLEREKFLEKRRDEVTEQWVYQLTAHGRLAALGGQDPEERWNRSWDGHWRMVLFDLPKSQQSLRVALLRWLRASRFGCLQNSLWITPDGLDAVTEKWGAHGQGAEALMLFEGRPLQGVSDADIVVGAWDFDEINRRYRTYLSHAADRPQFGEGLSAELLKDWISADQRLWSAAIKADPLLPQKLLPQGYEGRNAWRQRKLVWEEMRPKLKQFVA